MEKSDKQTDVGHPENGVNPLQTLKSLFLILFFSIIIQSHPASGGGKSISVGGHFRSGTFVSGHFRNKSSGGTTWVRGHSRRGGWVNSYERNEYFNEVMDVLSIPINIIILPFKMIGGIFYDFDNEDGRKNESIYKKHPEYKYIDDGIIEYYKDNLSLSADMFNKAIEINGNSGLAYNWLGGILYKNGYIDNAAVYWVKAIALDSDNCGAYINIGLKSFNDNNIDMALKYLESGCNADSCEEACKYLNYVKIDIGEIAVE